MRARLGAGGGARVPTAPAARRPRGRGLAGARFGFGGFSGLTGFGALATFGYVVLARRNRRALGDGRAGDRRLAGARRRRDHRAGRAAARGRRPGAPT